MNRIDKNKRNLHASRAYTSVRASSSLSRLIRGYDPEVAGGHPLAHLRGHGPQGDRGTDPLDPAFTGPDIVPNPLVQTGSTSAYESKQLSDGGLFLRIDMPGVPNDKFAVTVENGCVTVTGRAPAAMDDSSGREYRGNVAVVPRDYDSRRIEAFANEGVIRLIIHSI
ncbi:BnaA02g17910D [Brassica napus]|uniref:BnaA02g17910D protein n=1 Tax=Brassica napus TaxID=3708 RepID=A0A078I563_BRANA|nr:BnaA02g17910D [Brassica napus]